MTQVLRSPVALAALVLAVALTGAAAAYLVMTGGPRVEFV